MDTRSKFIPFFVEPTKVLLRNHFMQLLKSIQVEYNLSNYCDN